MGIAGEGGAFQPYEIQHLLHLREAFGAAVLAMPTSSRASPRSLSERGLQIIHLADYVHRQGGPYAECAVAQRPHWSHQGHLWVKEALLEHLQDNRHVCERPVG